MPTLRVISIGCLDAHPLRGEREPVRTGHATTSLIVDPSTNRRVLVDPGLPGPVIAARLSERMGMTPNDITHVFLTSFRPDVRRGLDAFTHATWWIGESERESVGVPMAHSLRRAHDAGDHDVVEAIQRDVAMLQRCEAAPDEIARDVTLFPLPGVTPGLSGLLVAEARYTTVVTGDAIPTLEHLEAGKAPQHALDVEQARSSFVDAVEVADLLVLGRDNVVVNPTKRPF